mgnify:CR=1 FL=1
MPFSREIPKHLKGWRWKCTQGAFLPGTKNDLFEATGDVILSKSAVSNVTEALYKDFEEFQGRDLSCFDVEYLFLDAVYKSLRMRFNVKEAILCT